MLLNMWYILSGLVGVILCIAGIISALIGGLFLMMGIPIAIKEGDYDEIPFLLGIIGSCAIVVLITIAVNIYIPKNQRIVSLEIPNIVSYQGIANVKEGKYNYDNMYFEQGINNNYIELKLDSNKCKIHYTNDNKIKVIENHTEYLSQFKYLAVSCYEDNIYYDVYLPKK